MINLKKMSISGANVLPLVEGGKGVAVSNGTTAGAWAAAGGVGTFSGVNPDVLDDNGDYVPIVYKTNARRERHEELVDYSIRGCISQAKRAADLRGSEGRIHINVLWEMGSCERVLRGAVEGAPGLIHGVTCGAGMPYKLAEIAAEYSLFYYPIVSSARAFNALWRRSYKKIPEWLGGVVYEDPWLAGGHNGLSNSENADEPERPYERVLELRNLMRKYGLSDTPIVMAGGVWHLNDWADWIDNPELGPIAFQFGSRPLLTRESPIPQQWKDRLPTLEKGDVWLQRFSPTGFYSSAVKNSFLRSLGERSERQIAFSETPDTEKGSTEVFALNARKNVHVSPSDAKRIQDWNTQGYTTPMKTPDNTMIFVEPEDARQIKRDQFGCMGCLSHCRFSNWKDHDDYTTGKLPDPRSFCIQKALQSAAHEGEELDDSLMFAGQNATRFGADPFYSNGFVPTVRELVERICTGE